MSLDEWWWVFDAYYIKAMKSGEGGYTSRDEWDDLHKRHKEKYG